MTEEITPEEVAAISQPQTSQEPPIAGQPLTHAQLVQTWKNDPYWGVSGDYIADPLTGKRTPVGA
jgi:hypothetical protein